jgi:hypothetical protein
MSFIQVLACFCAIDPSIVDLCFSDDDAMVERAVSPILKRDHDVLPVLNAVTGIQRLHIEVLGAGWDARCRVRAARISCSPLESVHQASGAPGDPSLAIFSPTIMTGQTTRAD